MRDSICLLPLTFVRLIPALVLVVGLGLTLANAQQSSSASAASAQSSEELSPVEIEAPPRGSEANAGENRDHGGRLWNRGPNSLRAAGLRLSAHSR